MLTRRLLVIAVAATLGAATTLSATVPAAAQPDCRFESGTGPDGEEVYIWTCGEEGGGGSGSGGGEWTCHTNVDGVDVQVPCVDPTMGWFTSTHGGCYIKPKSPQPPAGSDEWEGNEPGDGVVYTAFCFAANGVDGMPYVHLPTTIFFSSVEGPIPDLIDEAIARLALRGPDIQLAPDPSGAGLVGLPVWMWTPATAETWGPAGTSLTALGLTVHVEANAQQIRWDMGDGTEVICEDPGTPYDPAYGADPSPTCPHTYQQPSRGQPDGRYTVTATTEWRIDWEFDETTISGYELRTRTSSTTVRINELQVVTS